MFTVAGEVVATQVVGDMGVDVGAGFRRIGVELYLVCALLSRRSNQVAQRDLCAAVRDLTVVPLGIALAYD